MKNLAKHLSIPFVEKKFSPDEMIRADEVFITSTTLEISPIICVDNNQINDGTPGSVTKALKEQFKKII